MNKPNILFMITHDTGRYLGTYGYDVDTPEIDKIAEEGIRFDEYYCPAPQCSPSRGSILTGRYPHNHGLIGLSHKGFSINEEITTLPKELNKANYETTLVGLSHETIGDEKPRKSSSTTKLGYQNYIPVEGNLSTGVADEIIELLEEKNKEQSEPFFINAGFEETHRPFEGYEEWEDDPDTVKVPDYLPDTQKTREDFAKFHGSIKALDKDVGRIMNKLRNSKFYKNTIVVFTTDHGIAFPRAKGTLKDAGLETALIISSPDLIKKGVVNDDLLNNIDLMPTLLELAGVRSADELDGRSFASLLSQDSKPEKVREEFFAEMTWHDKYHPIRGIRTEKFKYILNLEDGPKIYMPLDIHKSLSGEEVQEEYYVPNEPEELYDLDKDPLEENNIINNSEYKEVAQNLRQKVKVWMEESNDPLLNGPVEGISSESWKEEEEKGRTYKPKE